MDIKKSYLLLGSIVLIVLTIILTTITVSQILSTPSITTVPNVVQNTKNMNPELLTAEEAVSFLRLTNVSELENILKTQYSSDLAINKYAGKGILLETIKLGGDKLYFKKSNLLEWLDSHMTSDPSNK